MKKEVDMDKLECEELKAKFLKVFANVPLPLREEIIVMIEDKPLSWNTVYAEFKMDTVNVKEIITRLKLIGVL